MNSICKVESSALKVQRKQRYRLLKIRKLSLMPTKTTQIGLQ